MLRHVPKIMIVVAAGLGFVGSGPTLAHDPEVSVRQAWSRATPKGAKVAGGYLSIVNNGVAADRLMSASSQVAGKVEIHRMSMQDGIMTMRPREEGLAIPPDATVTLAPGGDHIMFIDLAGPFEEGQRIPVTLNFQRSGKIETTFDVGSVGAMGPGLQLASREVASKEAGPVVVARPGTPVRSAGEPFFTHLCGTRVMADVTITPGRSGPVEVAVQLYDGDERPLTVDGLSVTLTSPDGSGATLTARAERVAADRWRADMTAASSGIWTLALGVDMKKDDRIDIAAPVVIE